jgi:hypothetical protein
MGNFERLTLAEMGEFVNDQPAGHLVGEPGAGRVVGGVRKPSANNIRFQCWRRCCISFPSGFRDFSARQRLGVSQPAAVRLLDKLLVEELTKSHAYRTTDHALVEGMKRGVRSS